MKENERFNHVCRDDNLRFVRRNGELILEQQRYTNVDENGYWIEYAETKWFPVPIIEEK